MGRRSRSHSSSGSRSPSPRYVPGFRVHVADLGMEPSKRELEKHFDRFGKIIDIWVAKTPPCFAFVVYQKKEEADKAILGMDGQIVANGRVRVSMARPRTRGRTGASFDPNLRCYQCGEKGHFSRDCNVYLGRFRNINYYTSSSSSRSRSRSRSRDRRSRRRSDSRSRRRSRSRHRSRSRSRHRRSRSRRSRSRDRRKSRSKDRKRNRSKERQRSRSKDRKRSQSKDRKRSRSKDRKRSRSKDRKRSRSKDRKRSRSKDRKRSRSKDRKRSRSNERKRSRSKDEKRSRSNERKRSRSKDRKRSRSNERKRSRSKERKRSRSKDRKRSRSNERKRSRSKDRKRSRSKDRKRSRSKDGKRSRSRSPKKSRDKKSPSRSHKKSQGEEASKTAEKKSIENAKTENASKANTIEEETTEIKTKPQAEAERPSGKEADIVSGDSADEKHTHEESKGDKPDDADIPVSMSGDQVAQLTVAQTKPSPDSNGVAAGGDGIPTTLSSNGPRDTDTLATDTQLRGDEFANADRPDLYKKPVGDVSTIGSSQAQFTNAAPDHMGDQTTERGDISTKPEPDISSDASLNLTLDIEQRV